MADDNAKEEYDGSDVSPVEEMGGQPCPMCMTKNLTLREEERDIPFFGKVFIFSMTCSNCKYHKSDIECADKREPTKLTLDVTEEDDMKIRIVKSAEATIKIPHMITIESGPQSNGFITNVEGLLNRVKTAIETTKNDEEDKTKRKKAKNMLKKLQKVMWGQEKLTISIEDYTGNSAIISDKVKISKLKKK